MSLLEKIKGTRLNARKAKDVVSARVLTTLIGEAEMIGKNAGNRQPTDEEVISTIKKFVKNLDETIRIASDYRDFDRADVAEKEKEVLVAFLPTQLTEDVLKTIITDIVVNLDDKSPKAMGKVLGTLKQFHAGLYDGALASKLTKEILSNS